MKIGFSTDRGRIRENNQDNCNVLADHPEIPMTFIIADGMGGHNSGETASRLAVEYITDAMLRINALYPPDTELCTALPDMIKGANGYIYGKSIESAETMGMGTTLIVASVWNGKLTIGHVGDSRVYLLRNGSMERITTDHSLVEELVKSGSLTREEAENHPRKHVITRAIGCQPDIEVDVIQFGLKTGDRLILCTDGLTNMLPEKDIRQTVEKYDDPDAACRELIRRANDQGGEDNITVIVFEYE